MSRPPSKPCITGKMKLAGFLAAGFVAALKAAGMALARKLAPIAERANAASRNPAEGFIAAAGDEFGISIPYANAETRAKLSATGVEEWWDATEPHIDKQTGHHDAPGY